MSAKRTKRKRVTARQRAESKRVDELFVQWVHKNFPKWDYPCRDAAAKRLKK